MITRHRSSGRTRAQVAPAATRPDADRVELVCIGASTGGPPALRTVLGAFHGPPKCPVLAVQHMSRGFMGGMVDWLKAATGQEVRLAEDGARLEPGVVFVAGDGGHLEIGNQRLRVTSSPPLDGHRPAVDRLFQSVARSRLASRTVGVVLTGMGSDGARGLGELRNANAWTIAQEEASCAVYGMPKAAVELEAACEVLPLIEIANYLGSVV